eukprot:TCALIF_13974-PA protein Name:"Protein of unknown function" AED:0.00 eAED:0.00 QI:80/1/1/1/1/1/2/135/88
MPVDTLDAEFCSCPLPLRQVMTPVLLIMPIKTRTNWNCWKMDYSIKSSLRVWVLVTRSKCALLTLAKATQPNPCSESCPSRFKVFLGH